MRITGILASFALAASLLPAQKKPPAAPTGTGAPGTTSAPPAASLPSTNNPPDPNANPSFPARGPFFFGKVVMPDGTAPSSTVTIERVCNGNPRPQAYTDSSGNFSFQVGQTQDVLPDATVDRANPGIGSSGSQRGLTDAFACDLRASLAGYRSDLISLAGRRNLDDPNVGTITLHPLMKVEGLTTSATSELAPKEARKAFEKGVEAAKKSRTDDAQTDFMKAVQIYPRYAAAWCELGHLYELRGDDYMARNSFSKSIEADSKFVQPYEGLYLLSIKELKWKEAAATTDRVIRLNSYDFPDAFYYSAVANLELGKLDVAEKSARDFIAGGNATRNPKVYYVLGLVLAKKQDPKGGAECLRTYLKTDKVTDRERVTKLLAEVEKQEQAKVDLKP